MRVIISDNQTCCGAYQEHTGLEGVDALRAQNRRAFPPLDIIQLLDPGADFTIRGDNHSSPAI